MAVHLSCRNGPSAPSPSPTDDPSHPSNIPIPDVPLSPARAPAASSPVRRSARLHHSLPPADSAPSPTPSSSMLKLASPNNDISPPNPRKRTRSESHLPPGKLESLRGSTSSPSPTRKSPRLLTQGPPTPSSTPRVKRQKVSPLRYASQTSTIACGRGSATIDKSTSPDYKAKSADASAGMRRKRKENASLHKAASPPGSSHHGRSMKSGKKCASGKGKEKEVEQVLPSPPETPTLRRRSLRNRDVLIPPTPTPLSAHSKSRPTPSSKGKGTPQNPLTLSPTFVGQAAHVPSPLSPHASSSSLNGPDTIATPPSSPTRASVDFELDIVDMGIPALSLPSPLSGNVLTDRKPSSSTLSSPLSSPPQSPAVVSQPSLSSVLQGLSEGVASNQPQSSEAPSGVSSSSPVPSADVQPASTAGSDSPSSSNQPTSPQSSAPPSDVTWSGVETVDNGHTVSTGGEPTMPTYSDVPMSEVGFSNFEGQAQNPPFDNPQNITYSPVEDSEAHQIHSQLEVPSVQYVPVDERDQAMYPEQQQPFDGSFHQPPQFGQDAQFQIPPLATQFSQDQQQFQAPAASYPPAPPAAVQAPIPDVYLPQQVWWEQPPDVSKESLWKGACKIRVWDIRRRYTPETIRSVVAQEAHDYFSEHGFPLGYGSPSPPSSRSPSLRREDSQRSADGFMDEEYYDWELQEDEDMEMDEDEEEEDMEEEEEIEREVEEEKRRQQMLSMATVKRPSGLRQEIAVEDEKSSDPEEIEEGDEDAEGEMEVDIAPYEDPSFNPDLSSPTSSAPPSPLSPGETLLSSFYVPVSPSPSVPSSPSPFAQSPLPQAPLQIHIPPAPILPLPPPPLASVRVYALRSLELGTKIMGRGTPVDKNRTGEWARVWRLKAERKAEERRANAMAYLYGVQPGDGNRKADGRTEVQDGVKLHLPTSEEMQMDQQRGSGSLGSEHHLDAELKPPASSPFHEWGALFTNFNPEQDSSQERRQQGQVTPTTEFLPQTQTGAQSMDVDTSSGSPTVPQCTNTNQERFLSSSAPSSNEPMMNMNMFNLFGNMSWFGGDMAMDMDNASNSSSGPVVSGASLSMDGYSPVDATAGGTSTLSFALG